jgi:pimeloyl-ACP methyl ester carboxylesterase
MHANTSTSRRIFIKIMRIIGITYLVLFILSCLFSSCFTFILSQKEIDKSFEGLLLKPKQHQLVNNGSTINYAEIGNDSLPTAFFVHGSPGSWSAFIDFMKDTLLLRKVKIVSVDRPGFGDSDLGEGQISLQIQAAQLKPIVEKYKKNGKKMILIGHSLGGPLIVKMAMDYPELIDYLIIAAGSVAPELEPNEKWFRVPMNFFPIKILIPKAFIASNYELLHLKSELEKMLPFWKNIKQPVTIIQGNKDVLVDPKNADFSKKMLVNSQKVEVVIEPEMNHFIPWSHPYLIKNAVLNASGDSL